jgi:NitT/TauT family transport system substrate-binding protein
MGVSQQGSKGRRRRSSWGRTVVATTAAATAALAISACGSSSDGSSSASGSSGKGNATITVGIPTDDASYAPLYLAEDKGLFAKYHVTVKPVVFKGGAELAKAVAGGSVDIAVSALSEMLLATQQHQPLKAFYGGYDQTSFAWFAQKGITTVDAAKGKKWGVTKIGSSTDFLTRYLFSQHGIDPETGATIVGVGGSAAQLASLKAKQIDATSASNLTAYQLEAAGYPMIAKQSDFAKEYPNHVAYAKTDFLNGSHAAAQHFLQGMVDGMNQAKADPAAAENALVKHMHVSMALAKRAYDDNLSGWHPDGRLPSEADMNVFWKIGTLNGQWPKAIPESQWLDRSFMDSYKTWSGGSATS